MGSHVSKALKFQKFQGQTLKKKLDEMHWQKGQCLSVKAEMDEKQ